MAALTLLIAAALVSLATASMPHQYGDGDTSHRNLNALENGSFAFAPTLDSVLNREAKLYMQGGSRSKIAGKEESSSTAFDEEERILEPHGSAAALFVLYGGYRGGPNSFAAVGLGYKPLYLFAMPEFECYWVPETGGEQKRIKTKDAYAMLPDYGYGRVYTTVVVNCTFAAAVGTSEGGKLVVVAYHGDDAERPPEQFVALTEGEKAYNASAYEAAPAYQYEYLYCGSPLYGNLNAQRLREWIAYHLRLFGPKSHFVFHDAGGMNAEVRAVLEPWQRLGYVSVQNVKRQAEFDAYYYNQFLIINDCLHRTKFWANWTFFFDVDEYIYIAPHLTFPTVMSRFRNATMLRFAQLRMSDVLCQGNTTVSPGVNLSSARPAWAFEKLVYGEGNNDMKFAVQARQVFATGVHFSQVELGHMEGEVAWAEWADLRFYHYHNTINKHEDICQVFAGNATSYSFNEGRTSLRLDTSMVPLGPLVKKFELEMIGERDPHILTTI